LGPARKDAVAYLAGGPGNAATEQAIAQGWRSSVLNELGDLLNLGDLTVWVFQTVRRGSTTVRFALHKRPAPEGVPDRQLPNRRPAAQPL